MTNVSDLKVHRCRNVKIPVRAPNALGYDFFLPDDLSVSDIFLVKGGLEDKQKNLLVTDRQLSFNHHIQLFIPLGIQLILPLGYGMILKEKSGLAKRGLRVHAGVIDNDYVGEVLLHVSCSHTDNRCTLILGEKVVQGILVKNPDAEIIDIDYPTFSMLSASSKRGDGGWGSTGQFE